MSRTLRRDIYSLHTLGCPIEHIAQPEPDPLAAIRYSYVHWINYLRDWAGACVHHQDDLYNGGVVDTFLRKKYLYWLESFGLLQSVSAGVLSMAKLKASITVILI
jgi:hypothetical protein